MATESGCRNHRGHSGPRPRLQIRVQRFHLARLEGLSIPLVQTEVRILRRRARWADARRRGALPPQIDLLLARIRLPELSPGLPGVQLEERERVSAPRRVPARARPPPVHRSG